MCDQQSLKTACAYAQSDQNLYWSIEILWLLKPQLHCHDFGHDGATTHPDLSSRGASAWVVVAP